MTNFEQRRVVVTGMGITCPLGSTLDKVAANLKAGVSGITAAPQFADKGFGSQVGAFVRDLPELEAERTVTRSFGDGNLLKYSYYAMGKAIEDSGLTPDDVENAGILFGTGGPSTKDQVKGAMQTLERGKPHANASIVIQSMCSGSEAILSTFYKVKKLGFSISAACSTSAISIGEAAWMIKTGRADVMFAGGAESADWELALGFDVMKAMCRNRNDDPTRASRPFDAERSGFVLGEGAGAIVLEELEHARARGARIYGELVGYGQTHDGNDLTNPDKDGALRAIREAFGGFGHKPVDRLHVDYINAHSTSTPVGDANEMRALSEMWAGCEEMPWIGSTKSLTGHSLGAAGVHEAIYSLLMMRDDFLAVSANIDMLDPLAKELGIDDVFLIEGLPDYDVTSVMSNSFGFGGVNACLIFNRDI